MRRCLFIRRRSSNPLFQGMHAPCDAAPARAPAPAPVAPAPTEHDRYFLLVQSSDVLRIPFRMCLNRSPNVNPPIDSSSYNVSVTFADAPSSETFYVSLGIGPVAALARHLSIAPLPENWTLGQRRKLIKSAIRERSALEPIKGEESDGSGHRGNVGAKTRRRAIGRSVCCIVRCAESAARQQRLVVLGSFGFWL